MEALHWLGNVYEHLKDFDESEKCYRKATELRRSVLGDDDAETLRSARMLGGVLLEQKKYQQAG